MTSLVEVAYLQLTDHRSAQPPPEAWEVAIDKNAVAEFNQGEISIDELSELVDDYQDIIDTNRRLKSPRGSVEEAISKEDHRADALARIFALEAAERDFVVAFRTGALDGITLDIDEIEEWIQNLAVVEGKETAWVTLPLKGDGSIDWPRPEHDYDESEKLLYYTTEQRHRRHVPVRVGGTLDRLRNLARQLSKLYGWREEWAATFLLTNETPPVPDIKYRINQPWPWWQARRSVTLTTPLWVPPKQVADMYQELRRSALKGEGFPRAVSKKTADLAVFAARNNEGRTWWETMRLWNKEHRDWRYDDSALFTRDCRAAFKRVTGQTLRWGGKHE